ncbi:MAG: BNR-4 repeat-containing protein [Leadbetterella sp.]
MANLQQNRTKLSLILFAGLVAFNMACMNKKEKEMLNIIEERTGYITENAITSTANKTVTTNHTGNCSTVNEGDTYTPITTATDGTIYSAWIDDNLGLRVLQIKTDGTKNEVVVRTNVQSDNYHVRPAIAVDKDGKIHVAGDMHNDSWAWYISNSAGSITGGFTQLNPPGGSGITYPQFFKDKNNELYITFRNKVKEGSEKYTQGSNGGGIIKYISTSSFWLMGGTSHNLQKTLVWSNTGGGGTAKNYQKPSLRLFFDNNNRMHLICNLINEDSDGTSEVNTHVLYAYSNDGGNTWKKLDGTAISSLPMTVTTMTQLAYRSQNDIASGCFLGANSNGYPIIGYRDGGGTYIKRYTGSSWANAKPESDAPQEVYMRRNGEICVVRPFQGVYISTDNGANYVKYTFSPALSSPNNFSFDREFYLNSGGIRFQYMNSSKTSCITATMTR